MTNAEKPSGTSIKLVVVGEDLIPEIVTNQLGLAFSEAWTKGDLVFGHPAKKGVWKLYDEKSTMNDSLLEEKLEFWSELLEAKVDGLHNLYELGYDVRLICFIQYHSPISIGLSNEQLVRIAELGIDLVIDVINFDQSVDRESL